jgi:hypothetical protein
MPRHQIHVHDWLRKFQIDTIKRPRHPKDFHPALMDKTECLPAGDHSCPCAVKSRCSSTDLANIVEVVDDRHEWRIDWMCTHSPPHYKGVGLIARTSTRAHFVLISTVLRDHLVVGCSSLKAVTLVRIQVPQQNFLTEDFPREARK